MTFGIIGYGSFGKLIAKTLSQFGSVSVYDQKQVKKPEDNGIDFTSFEQVASKDAVILAVGLESLDEISRRLAGIVRKETVVVEVCSVKLKPIEILNKNLGGKCSILSTHPLFGPHSVKDGSVEGKSIVVCPSDFAERQKIIEFFKGRFKLNVIEMPAEEHDREMAWVHALTFFVGRGLMELDPPKSSLTTGYYQKLLDLVELEATHSIELFNTVQRGNPFAADIRSRLISELEAIDKQIGSS